LWNLTSDNSNKIDEFIKMNIASGANARKLANDLELLINPNNRIVTNNFKAVSIVIRYHIRLKD
jgi:hypothetical protein